jgi:hypothetical protein
MASPSPTRAALPADLAVLAGLFCAGLGATVLLAAATNVVNGRVSPGYFAAVLGWDEWVDIPRAAIGQGVFEGLIYGTGLSIVITAVVAVVSGGAIPFRRALHYLAAISGVALLGWVLGGLCGMGLAFIYPENNAFWIYRYAGAEEGAGSLLSFAWVGGSIDGLELGGVVGVILGSVVFRNRWRQEQAAVASNVTA